MTCVVGSGRKTRYCTGDGNWVTKDAEKQGFLTIFEFFFGARILQKLRGTIFVEWASTGDRRKWLVGCMLRVGP
jgi:hypothetical protein